MASAPAADEDLPECPVCHEELHSDPKILPCTHVVCAKCLLSWLQKGEGGDAGCPLCRAPVLEGVDDLAASVVKLPTDLATKALVKSGLTLRGPHVCSICSEEDGDRKTDVPATSYCLQCEVKLCRACSKAHGKYPSFKQHDLQDVGTLTPRQLAASRRTPCCRHPERTAEVWCGVHSVLICLLCAATSHESCRGKRPISEEAADRRRDLAQHALRLKRREDEVRGQISKYKGTFTIMRQQVKDTFDDLQDDLEKRRKEMMSKVKAEEEAAMTSISKLEKCRGDLGANARKVEMMMESASDDALLEMTSALTSRLDEVEKETEAAREVKATCSVRFEGQLIVRLKTAVASLGLVCHDGASDTSLPNQCPACGRSDPLSMQTQPVPTETLTAVQLYGQPCVAAHTPSASASPWPLALTTGGQGNADTAAANVSSIGQQVPTADLLERDSSGQGFWQNWCSPGAEIEEKVPDFPLYGQYVEKDEQVTARGVLDQGAKTEEKTFHMAFFGKEWEGEEQPLNFSCSGQKIEREEEAPKFVFPRQRAKKEEEAPKFLFPRQRAEKEEEAPKFVFPRQRAEKEEEAPKFVFPRLRAEKEEEAPKFVFPRQRAEKEEEAPKFLFPRQRAEKEEEAPKFVFPRQRAEKEEEAPKFVLRRKSFFFSSKD